MIITMQHCFKYSLFALFLAVPWAVRADVNESTVAKPNSAINLDTGEVGSTGGDILWNGTTMAPQGSAKARTIGKIGSVNFGFLTKASVTAAAQSGKSTPLTADVLAPGDAFAVLTNGGNAAKVLVLANSSGTITLQFTTYGASATSGIPAIYEAVNNSSFTPLGAANYGIAPSSLFAIAGTSLSDPGGAVLQSSTAGLPLTLNGTSVSVTVNGVVTKPALYYATSTQVAGVMPASTPIGEGTITVTYRGKTSAPAPIKIVPSALGVNQFGVNTGVATDAFTGKVLGLDNSGTPGETIALWATGLGADPADSDTTYTKTPHSVNTSLKIYIGGVAATILYQGSSGFPGVNQINLVIPNTAPSGCWVTLAAVAGSVLGNVVTLPINPGGGECVDSLTGLNGGQFAGGGRTLRTGLVALIQTDLTNAKGVRTITNSADTAFVKYTGLYTPANSLSPGGCIATPYITAVPVPGVTGLDVGAVTLSGPAGLDVTLKSQGIKGVFYALLASGGIPDAGGTFVFKGTGGADVGAFTSTLNLSQLMKWTNPEVATSIDRTKDMTVKWTGGNPGTYIFIGGTSTADGIGYGGFTCLTHADAGQFTVPSYILSVLPAGRGGAQVQNSIQLPLSATGIDIGLADATISHSEAATYQ
jgi:uncharacterized protein (TIGR03437 family)